MSKRRPLPNKMDHLKMQAAMPGTLNGDSALAELQQMGGPTAPTTASAGDTPTAPPPVPAPVVPAPVEQTAPPAVEPTPAVTTPDIEQSTATVNEQPIAPTPAAHIEQPAESTVPTAEGLEQANGVGAEGPEASKAAAPVTRLRRESAKALDKPTVSPGLDGSGGAVRISAAHANELLGARLHYQTEHNIKASNQGIVADALDHYLTYLRKKGVLPPKP